MGYIDGINPRTIGSSVHLLSSPAYEWSFDHAFRLISLKVLIRSSYSHANLKTHTRVAASELDRNVMEIVYERSRNGCV